MSISQNPETRTFLCGKLHLLGPNTDSNCWICSEVVFRAIPFPNLLLPNSMFDVERSVFNSPHFRAFRAFRGGFNSQVRHKFGAGLECLFSKRP